MTLLLEQTPSGSGIYLDWLLAGLGWTISLGLGAWILALAAGTIVGVSRTLPGLLVPSVARVYVEVFRNIPLLVQMFFWYFVFPELIPTSMGTTIKQMPPPWGSFVPALCCLGIYTSARMAEHLRAGIQSIPSGQTEAALSLGLPRSLLYREVLLPQAFRIIIPAVTNEVMAIFKNTSVAMTIGLIELTATAREINSLTFRTFEAFGWITVVYLVLALAIWRIMRRIEISVRIPGQSK